MKSLLRNYVNGEWVDTGRKYPNINPVDGSKVCDVSEADADTVDRAVKGAGGDERRLGSAQRCRPCRDAAQGGRSHRSALRRLSHGGSRRHRACLSTRTDH